MAYKTYCAGTRFNENYYILPIVYYNLSNPNLSRISIGIEMTNPQTGNKVKLQLAEPISLVAFQPVDDFDTDANQ